MTNLLGLTVEFEPIHQDNRTDGGEEFIRALYLGLLGREPDLKALSVFSQQLADGTLSKRGLAMAIVNSQEFKTTNSRGDLIPLTDLRVFQGYKQDDIKIFSRFDVSAVKPSPAFLTEWIGSRVRLSSLWRNAVREGADRVVQPLPIPFDFYSSAVEWIGALKAVLSAQRSFSVMELGAGYGPWLAASCAAARAIGISDLHVCGVEADPGRYELLELNMADNNLGDAVLYCGAIGVEGGRAKWPRIAEPTEDSGARPYRQSHAEDQRYFDEYRRNADFVDVEIVALPKLLHARPVWDLVHIDVQGTEVELCQGCIDDLTSRARYLVIGTHARWLDGDLMRLFFNAGWVLEHEVPSKMRDGPHAAIGYGVSADGTQVWRNPRI